VLSKKTLTFGVAITTILIMLLVFDGRSPERVFDDGPLPGSIEPRLSTIATPVTISIEQLRQLADNSLSGEIYRENREITTGISVDINVRRRTGPIEMTMVNSVLMTTVPLTVSGTPNISLGPFRLPSGTAGGFDADLDLTLRTSAQMNSDWSVSSETTVDIMVGRAELSVAGTDTDVRPIVSDILQRNSARFAAPLDAYLSNLDILAMLTPIWERLGAPVQLSDDPSVWLRIRPIGFSLSAPDAEADNLRFDIGMEVYLDSVVGPRPEYTRLGPIPPLAEASSDIGSFSVAIPISLQLAEATRILSERIIGREDSIGDNATVRWLGVDLGGTDNRLRVAVLFEAETGFPIVSKLTGEMVLVGRPRYDSASQTLTMQNIDYDLNSDSTLAGLADWLVHDKLRDRIQAEMVFPMDEIIEDIRQDLQAELENISFGDYGTAEAKLATLEPTLLRVTNNTLDLALVANGTLVLNLNLEPVFNGP
jgi:hypothetical protein